MKMLLYIPSIFGISIEVYLILIILGIPTFLFWRWLLKKFIKVDNPRKIATWAATIFLTPLIYVGIVILWISIISYYPSNDFDREKWLSEKEKRYELSEDIVESNMLIGKSKAEVRQLLGDEENSEDANYWDYYLGYRPQLFGIDPDFLNIEFKDGKVVKVSQHES